MNGYTVNPVNRDVNLDLDTQRERELLFIRLDLARSILLKIIFRCDEGSFEKVLKTYELVAASGFFDFPELEKRANAAFNFIMNPKNYKIEGEIDFNDIAELATQQNQTINQIKSNKNDNLLVLVEEGIIGKNSIAGKKRNNVSNKKRNMLYGRPIRSYADLKNSNAVRLDNNI